MTEEQRRIIQWEGYANDALDMFKARHKPYWIGDTTTNFRDQARNQIKICRKMPAEARKHFAAKRKHKYSSDEVAKALAGAKRLGDKLLKARQIDPVKWRTPFTI